MSASAELNVLPTPKKVAAVVVNWRQPTRTLAVVSALRNQSLQPLIIVVDNGSEDDSVDILRRNLPSRDIVFLLRDENGGFGAGCNAGIEKAQSLGADYIWLVNNDAVPEVSCLEKMMRVAVSDPAVGAVGATIKEPARLVPDHAGTVMSCVTLNCRYSLSENDFNTARYAWITGACMLLNVDALKHAGVFDPIFFMYWEDADLCARLRNCGYRLAVARDAVVYHSAGTSSEKSRLKRFEWHIYSQNRWISKNYRFKRLGLIMVCVRHLAKSIADMDWPRLKMTLEYYRSIGY